jgi:uncharacterized protein
LSNNLLLPLTALIAGLARGFSGFGAALIFMPLASALIGPRLAAPTFMVMDAVVALPMLRDARTHATWAEVLPMLAGAVVGVPAGTFILTHADATVLRWVIVGLGAIMLGLLISGWRYHGQPHRFTTAVVGVISGICGGAAQIAGPPVVAYWMGGPSARQVVRANMVMFFAGTTLLQIFTYGGSGLITGDAAVYALISGPAYGLGLYGGSKIFGWADEAVFRRISLVLIALALLVSLPVWR